MCFTIFFLYINVTNNYYQKHKEKLRKEACERYQNLFEEKKKQRAKKCPRQILKSFRRRESKRNVSTI